MHMWVDAGQGSTVRTTTKIVKIMHAHTWCLRFTTARFCPEERDRNRERGQGARGERTHARRASTAKKTPPPALGPQLLRNEAGRRATFRAGTAIATCVCFLLLWILWLVLQCVVKEAAGPRYVQIFCVLPRNMHGYWGLSIVDVM